MARVWWTLRSLKGCNQSTVLRIQVTLMACMECAITIPPVGYLGRFWQSILLFHSYRTWGVQNWSFLLSWGLAENNAKKKRKTNLIDIHIFQVVNMNQKIRTIQSHTQKWNHWSNMFWITWISLQVYILCMIYYQSTNWYNLCDVINNTLY